MQISTPIGFGLLNQYAKINKSCDSDLSMEQDFSEISIDSHAKHDTQSINLVKVFQYFTSFQTIDIFL